MQTFGAATWVAEGAPWRSGATPRPLPEQCFPALPVLAGGPAGPWADPEAPGVPSDPALVSPATVDALERRAADLQRGEHPDAHPTAVHALRLCRLLGERVPPATTSRVLARLGSICVSNHDWPRAARFLRMALDAQGGVRDIVRSGQVFSDLSAATLAAGDLDRAVGLGRKALQVLTAVGDRPDAARAEHRLGLALLRQRRLTTAEPHLEGALEAVAGLGTQRGLGQFVLGVVELRAASGAGARARGAAAVAEALCRLVDERMTRAEALEWLGRLAEAEGRPATADRCFGEAIHLLAASRSVHRQAECHARYARLLEARGDGRSAMLQYRAATLAARAGRAYH